MIVRIYIRKRKFFSQSIIWNVIETEGSRKTIVFLQKSNNELAKIRTECKHLLVNKNPSVTFLILIRYISERRR